MQVLDKEQLRQRADYTYKFNANTGRHGWLRLTPAYSVKIVEEIIVGHERARRVLDPFCGTGTTALSATYHGHEAVTIDINPFLVWLTRVKTAHYRKTDINRAQAACSTVLDIVKKEAIEATPVPPIHNIERWWGKNALTFLCLLRTAIAEITDLDSPERNLLTVAFCRTLIALSNAAFNHQSMSFKSEAQMAIALDVDMGSVFAEAVKFVLQGATENPTGSSLVVLGDSRNAAGVVDGKFDFVVTSPPYANRMSYIRELRPYMYWLGYLVNGRDAGELDWSAIGGTWGIATSRLADWARADEHFKSKKLDCVVSKIAHADNKNGALLANYVAKYFDDMWAHFKGLAPVLTQGAEIHYIVGNSTFYGQLVSTEIFYGEMLASLGFNNIECRPIRKRNSKKELVEFDVIARWRNG